MKQILLLLLTVFIVELMQAQSIDVKKGIIYVDGKECLKVDKSDPNSVSIADLNDNDIIYLKYIHNTRYASLYNKIIFLHAHETFTSKTFIYTVKLLMKRLLDTKVIDNCTLNPDRIDNFVLKYDENVEWE